MGRHSEGRYPDNPFRTTRGVIYGIKGRRDCTLFVKDNVVLSEEIILEVGIRNIELIFVDERGEQQ